jgi:hypothetical protein
MAASVKQFTTPYLIRGDLKAAAGTRLEKVELTAKASGDGPSLYDENWIQRLIFENPSLLPVKELEPGFVPLYSVCRELQTPAGPLDNLFVSENGGLVLVECKLWRNSEARREVIGQALDYAKEVSRWSYDDLVQAVKQTTKSSGDEVLGAVRRGAEDLDEVEFIDAVTRNLKRGRFLLLIVGDGIREGVEEITNFLQQHVGLDFTFGLVELAVFKAPDKEEYVVQPRILANSYTVERGVIRVEAQGAVSFEPPATPAQPTAGSAAGKRTNISEQDFYEQLSVNATPQAAAELRKFMARLSEIGIVPAYASSSLNLRWFPESNRKMNFGSINKNGLIDTDPANWVPTGLGRRDIGEAYQEALKTIVGGNLKQAKNGAGYTLRVVRPDGTNTTLAELLKHQDAWIELMKRTQAELAKAIQAYEGD